MSKKHSKLTILSSTALGSIAFVGTLVLVAFMGKYYSVRFDLTEGKRYSISDQSQKIAK